MKKRTFYFKNDEGNVVKIKLNSKDLGRINASIFLMKAGLLDKYNK